MSFLSAAASYYRDGGVFMHVILATAVVIAAIVIERMIVIGRASTFNGRRFTDDLARAIGRGDLATARNMSAGSTAPPARVAQAMLHVGPTDETTLQAAADDAATLALPALSRRLAHLGMLANTATLLGLLGTIFGLTTAFAAVGAADPAQRSTFLAAGISQALNTTAFGLMVAVPTLIVHGWLASVVEGIAEQVDEATVRISRALASAIPSAGRVQLTAVAGAKAAPAAPAGSR